MTLKLLSLLSICVLTYSLAPLVFTCEIQESYNISLRVQKPFVKPVTYRTSIKYRGILLGAMKNLQADPIQNFTFTTKDNLDYGPFLVKVNGLAGNPDDHTYWEIRVEMANGTKIRPDVGVGCYIPNPNDLVIFNFTTWKPKEKLYSEQNTCGKFT